MRFDARLDQKFLVNEHSALTKTVEGYSLNLKMMLENTDSCLRRVRLFKFSGTLKRSNSPRQEHTANGVENQIMESAVTVTVTVTVMDNLSRYSSFRKAPPTPLFPDSGCHVRQE
jgi:hypothetical protein